MSKKISHTLVGGRTVAGTGGQGLKIGEQGRLYWKDVDEESLIPLTWYGGRGVIGGALGVSNSFTNSGDIEYITIASTGNDTDFGDLTVVRADTNACSNGSRGVFAGGWNASWAVQNTMDYITISTTGNATDFGDLATAVANLAGISDGTKGIFAGGNTGSVSNVIQYV